MQAVGFVFFNETSYSVITLVIHRGKSAATRLKWIRNGSLSVHQTIRCGISNYIDLFGDDETNLIVIVLKDGIRWTVIAAVIPWDEFHSYCSWRIKLSTPSRSNFSIEWISRLRGNAGTLSRIWRHSGNKFFCSRVVISTCFYPRSARCGSQWGFLLENAKRRSAAFLSMRYCFHRDYPPIILIIQ